MSRDIHDYDSLKEAYNDLLMFERFPGPAHSERVEEFVIQLKRDIRVHPSGFRLPHRPRRARFFR